MLFDLFRAPLSEAGHCRGPGTCVFCAERQDHCFVGGEHLDVVVACGHCALEVGASSLPDGSRHCARCASVVPPAKLPAGYLVCAGCTKGHRAAFRHQALARAVHWEDIYRASRAADAATHGSSCAQAADKFPAGQWRELVATPTLSTWQDHECFVCCNGLMRYLGAWTRADDQQAAPNKDGRAFFAHTMHDPEALDWDTCLPECGGTRMYQCPRCSNYEGFIDAAYIPATPERRSQAAASSPWLYGREPRVRLRDPQLL